jgi:hypothetical protein
MSDHVGRRVLCMTVRNEAAVIGRCLDSVLQTGIRAAVVEQHRRRRVETALLVI